MRTEPTIPLAGRRLPTRAAIAFLGFLASSTHACLACPVPQEEPQFGKRFPNLDSRATGKWWEKARALAARDREDATSDDPKARARIAQNGRFVTMDVPRDEVVAFALYTRDAGILKLTAQLYPLLPGEDREVHLELEKEGAFERVATTKVVVPGWSAHFRIEDQDPRTSVRYRVRHGANARFEGLIRRDPDRDTIVIASLSCNSSRTPGARDHIVTALAKHDPDLLFFAGDQTYHHTEHTAGWIQFGLQFRDVLRNRPVVTIPDDHDVGQSNLWGEGGKQATNANGPSGGYFYPASYVNMVQRQQTWHLPDPNDATPIGRGITVYYTRLRVGGIDFAILEDRKWKSGPEGKIPKLGPRPDHIVDPAYDRSAVDLPELELLGPRQMAFLAAWGEDWRGAEYKVVLSQTAFCGAVHMHGSRDGRLLADLDSNAWPQHGRNDALRALRRVRALHLCGDQHLAVVVKHGVEAFGDGPYAFTSPAIVNTVYGRWWHPLDEQPGPDAVDGPLPWTGNYLDGLGNRISMLAYANPEDVRDERKRGDGYGIVRIDKKLGMAHVECWPRFSDPDEGDSAQFPGWPIDLELRKNDGRRVHATLDPIAEPGVVQVVRKEDGEILYTLRVRRGWQPPVFGPGTYTVKFGVDRPERILVSEHVVR
ncbi:MAG: hypothetical protein H6832_07700 [Planctomycetes bacterium]|nr:hypothetical protein [Planctomycetota bacterium]MCB9918273.1 hypothetical protein [Planctomycetota bacterium]